MSMSRSQKASNAGAPVAYGRMLALDGKVAVVAGGESGIGLRDYLEIKATAGYAN
jgi:hypothetical protein